MIESDGICVGLRRIAETPGSVESTLHRMRLTIHRTRASRDRESSCMHSQAPSSSDRMERVIVLLESCETRPSRYFDLVKDESIPRADWCWNGRTFENVRSVETHEASACSAARFGVCGLRSARTLTTIDRIEPSIDIHELWAFESVGQSCTVRQDRFSCCVCRRLLRNRRKHGCA